MRRDVGGAIARLRTYLRVTAAERYRAALLEQSRLVPVLLLAAAVFDRAAAVARLARSVRDPRAGRLDRVIATVRRIRAPHALTVVRAAIGGTHEVSITVTGRPASCAAVRTLVLVRGEARVPLPTVVASAGGSVRLAATIRPDDFGPEVVTHRLAITDGTTELVAVTPSRRAISERWGARVFAAQPWPPRLVLDAQRQLTIEGQAPREPSIEHTVALGLTSAVISWTAPTDGAAALRFVPRAEGAPVVVAGRSGDGAARSATVDLVALAEHDDAVWAVEVGGGDTWFPLRLQPGDYPPLGSLPDSLEVPARRPDGRAVPVRIAYTDRNQLSVRVGSGR